jgi:hypothetical protein
MVRLSDTFVTDVPAASHEVCCTTESYLQHGCEPIGLARRRQKSLFPTLLRDLPYYRPPLPCEIGFILSCASASSEYVTAPSGTQPAGSVHLPWGLALHRDTSS